MGSYIFVNHSKFESAADAIDTYVRQHKKNMDSADLAVKELSITWRGKDAEQFEHQWDKANEGVSTSKKMINALENYADFLRFAAGEYKSAQSKAVNRANWL